MRSSARLIRTALSLSILVAQSASGGESGCSPYVEDQPRWNTAMLRPHTDAFRECMLTEDAYVKVVRGWLEGRDASGSGPESLGLGRLVHYPWLSAALAEAASSHPEWNRKRGKARGRDINALVASILSSEPILDRLGRPFRSASYRVDRVVVEKVLVSPAAEVWPGGQGVGGLLPFDAQAWLVLRRQP